MMNFRIAFDQYLEHQIALSGGSSWAQGPAPAALALQLKTLSALVSSLFFLFHALSRVCLAVLFLPIHIFLYTRRCDP